MQEDVILKANDRGHTPLVRCLGIATIFTATWLMLELVLWAAGGLAPLQFFTRRPAAPLERQAYDDYMQRRDSVLGWPSSAEFGGAEHDESGARRSPAFPQPGGACVSLYGDSFAFGSDVSAEQAWGNELSLILGCRVANYGVPGYGVDQAFLRFRQLSNDEAAIAVLVVFPDDVPRLLNQNRNLIFDSLSVGHGLKPRFIIGATGELELIPLPTLTYDEMRELKSSPSRFLTHEVFLPEGDYGQVIWEFPFTSSAVRILRGGRFQSSVAFKNFWQHFIDPSHPEHALSILQHIVRSFRDLAHARGKRAITILLPDAASIAEYRKEQSWPYQPVLDALAGAGRDTVDAGPVFLQHIGNRSVCEILLDVPGAGCVGHLNPEGSRVLARFAAEVLRPLVSSNNFDAAGLTRGAQQNDEVGR